MILTLLFCFPWHLHLFLQFISLSPKSKRVIEYSIVVRPRDTFGRVICLASRNLCTQFNPDHCVIQVDEENKLNQVQHLPQTSCLNEKCGYLPIVIACQITYHMLNDISQWKNRRKSRNAKIILRRFCCWALDQSHINTHRSHWYTL